MLIKQKKHNCVIIILFKHCQKWIFFRWMMHMLSPSLLDFLRICNGLHLLEIPWKKERMASGFIRSPPPCVSKSFWHITSHIRKEEKKKIKTHFSEQIASHWSPTTVDSCFMRAFSGKAVYHTQACKETMANWCSLLRASLRPLDAFYVKEACFLLFTKSCSPRVDNNPEQIWLSADARATRRAHGDDTHYCLGSQQK